MWKFILARLKEPSTWAGLATIAVSVGHPGGAALIGTISSVLVPVLGGLAVALPESSSAADRGGN